MIKLSEILHTIKDESKKGLTPVDNWNLLHATFLEDMDFKADGQYHYSLPSPKIMIAHKKGVGFVVEDKSKKQVHTFKDFNEVTDFFTKYNQKWENAPYQQNEEEEDREEIEAEKPKQQPNTIKGEGEKIEKSVKKWDKMNEQNDDEKSDNESDYGKNPNIENDPEHKWNPDIQNDPNYVWSTKRRERH
jgi:hypothetical protein